MSVPVLRVIVVDDYAESRQTLMGALAMAGHACVVAQGAQEALARCANERFDCMLLDEVLEDDSGLALAARLRTLAARPRRIVMMSGLAPEFFAEALRDGVIDGFIEKPLGLKELLVAVEPAAPSE